MGRFFEIIQISCSSSKYPCRLSSVLWWFLNEQNFITVAAQVMISQLPAPPPHTPAHIQPSFVDKISSPPPFIYLLVVKTHSFLFFSMVHNSLLFLIILVPKFSQISPIEPLQVGYDSLAICLFFFFNNFFTFWHYKMFQAHLAQTCSSPRSSHVLKNPVPLSGKVLETKVWAPRTLIKVDPF